MGYADGKNGIQNSDQWLLDGKCTECRKAKYCIKSCSAFDRRMQGELQKRTNKVFGNVRR